jgi:hypothetical protein
MFKVMALIVAGIFLTAIGIYALSQAHLPVIQLPAVSPLLGWGIVFGGLVSFGVAFVVTRVN